MLGLGETYNEIINVLIDLKEHKVDMITMGQYLQPTPHHLAVERYVPLGEFESLKEDALAMGFKSIASGPMVRSSYHADLQAIGKII
jgi:lipoic acid synthetase